MDDDALPAHASGQFLIGGDMPVWRIGYGTMQLTGPGHWYHPADTDNAKQVLRRAVELGINHLDTADAYGPETVEHLIRKALHPYPVDLIIATKGGLTRPGPNRWEPCGHPSYLRQCTEMSLRRLCIERLDLYYLHRIDPRFPLADQLEVLASARAAGKIRHIGISKVTIDEIAQARELTSIAAVQNSWNVDEGDADAFAYCETNGIAFVAYAPLAAGRIPHEESALATGTSRPRNSLANLLGNTKNVLVIPGTGNLAHLEANVRIP